MGNPSVNTSRIERAPDASLPSAAEQRAARLASGHVVIVCGGRDYADWERVYSALDRAHERKAITLLVHGATMNLRAGVLVGVDRWADAWAQSRGVCVERHPADTATWGKEAEAMRSKQLVEAGAHGMIAFPGEEADLMVKHAERCGIPVWRPFG